MPGPRTNGTVVDKAPQVLYCASCMCMAPHRKATRGHKHGREWAFLCLRCETVEQWIPEAAGAWRVGTRKAEAEG